MQKFQSSVVEMEMSGHRSSSVSDLPSCLIQLILVKLPIKTIIICKCVCKSWNQLIVDPYFTNLYSKHSPYTVMLQSQRPEHLAKPVDHFLEIGNNGDVIRTPFYTKQQHCDRRFFASCNGLLCQVIAKRVYNRYEFKSIVVINPLTGESVNVPRDEDDRDCFGDSYGFGSTLDGEYYKVVRIIIGCENGECKLHLKILTVGVDNEWRDFYDLAFTSGEFYYDGVFLNGVLHWVVFDDLDSSSSISAFDVGKEIGHRILAPSSDIAIGFLGVWSGLLCFSEINENKLQFSFWTMRQYGVTESWTKDIILRSSITSLDTFHFAFPRTTRRNGDLLLSIISNAYAAGHDCLISFDSKTKNCVKLYDDDVCNGSRSCLRQYAPCFSSLSEMISRQITDKDP